MSNARLTAMPYYPNQFVCNLPLKFDVTANKNFIINL